MSNNVSSVKSFVLLIGVVTTGVSITAAAFGTFETIKMHETTYQNIEKQLDRLDKRLDLMDSKITSIMEGKK